MITKTENKIIHPTDGSEDTFETGFRVLDERDLQVLLMAADGSVVEYKLDVDYTIVLAADTATVVCGSPPDDGGQLVLLRRTPKTQPVDLSIHGPLPAEAIENALDRLTIITQDLAEQADRTSSEPVIVPEAGEAPAGSLYLMTGTAFPDSPADGQLFYNTATKVVYAYNAATREWHTVGAATKAYLGLLPRDKASEYPLQDNLNVGGNRITNVGIPTANTDAATKGYIDARTLPTSGGTMAGNIDMANTAKIVNLPAPTDGGDAVPKDYVDLQFSTAAGHTHTGVPGQGPRIKSTDLDGSSIPDGAVLVSNGFTFDGVPLIRSDFTESASFTKDVWTTVCEVDAFCRSASDSVAFIFTARVTSAQAVDIRIMDVDENAEIKVLEGWFPSAAASAGMYGTFGFVYPLATKGVLVGTDIPFAVQIRGTSANVAVVNANLLAFSHYNG